jgi:DNA-binding CsgD family transcriptional regulator
LVIRYYPATAERSAAVRLVDWARPPSFLLLRSAGLTTRECEILHWLAQGKRDAEIAVVLACAPATVGKHVENLLRKLHTENRGGAVSTAREMLSR